MSQSRPRDVTLPQKVLSDNLPNISKEVTDRIRESSLTL